VREHGLLFTTKIGTPIEPCNLNRHLIDCAAWLACAGSACTTFAIRARR
jgi:hypothetical protein